MSSRSTNIPLALCVALLAACSNSAVYKDESFDSDSPYRMRTTGDASLACESARRALLGQGYLIETASSEGVKGRKAYKSDSAQNTFIEMNIVCLPEVSGSTLFANGLLSAYELKKSASSASVGVSALGSISLPIGQSADSLVKVSEETIDDKDYYRRFFAAVGTILDEMQADRVLPEPVPAPAESAPDPAPEPAPALVLESGSEPLPSPEPALEPAREAVPEPAPVPAPGPVPGSAPEPLPQPSSQPFPEPLPVPAPEPLAVPVTPADIPPAIPEPLPETDAAPAVLAEPMPDRTASGVVEAPGEVVPSTERATEPTGRSPDPLTELF